MTQPDDKLAAELAEEYAMKDKKPASFYKWTVEDFLAGWRAARENEVKEKAMYRACNSCGAFDIDDNHACAGRLVDNNAEIERSKPTEAREFKMAYTSGQNHRKAVEQATALAIRTKEFNADILTIEVKSEETYQLRTDLEKAEARVRELEEAGGFKEVYAEGGELISREYQSQSFYRGRLFIATAELVKLKAQNAELIALLQDFVPIFQGMQDDGRDTSANMFTFIFKARELIEQWAEK